MSAEKVDHGFLKSLFQIARHGKDIRSKLIIAHMYSIRKKRRFLVRLLRQLVPFSQQPIEISIVINNRQLHLRLDPQSGDRPSFFEIFEELPRSIFIDQPEPDIIIDAGANVGFFSLLSRAYFHTTPVHAFEPLPRNIERLNYHNDANDANITIHEKALWNVPGKLRFNIAAHNTSFVDGVTGVTANSLQQIEVEGVRLEKTLPEIAHSKMLLKMDIEGAEIQVLETVLPLVRKPSTILCELHNNAKNLERFLMLLREYQWEGTMLKNDGANSYWHFVNFNSRLW